MEMLQILFQQMMTLFQQMMNVERIDVDEGRFRLKATGGGFFARLFGLGSRATVTADSHGFRLHKITFSTEENNYIPRSKIASTVYVIAKPVAYLVLGLFLMLSGALGGISALAAREETGTVVAVIFLLLGLVFLVVYLFVKRQVIIGVESNGGTVESVKLKANQAALEDVREGMKILEELIREDTAPAAAVAAVPVAAPARPALPPPPPAPPAAPAGHASFTTCPTCGTRMSLPASAVGRKVRCASCREAFTATPDA